MSKVAEGSGAAFSNPNSGYYKTPQADPNVSYQRPQSLGPTEFFHSPGGVPYFDHSLDLVIRVHRQHVDIVGMKI